MVAPSGRIRTELRACDLKISSSALAARHGVPTRIIETIRKRMTRQLRRNRDLADFDATYRVPTRKSWENDVALDGVLLRLASGEPFVSVDPQNQWNHQWFSDA